MGRVTLPGPQRRAFLAALLDAPGQWLPPADLADEIWPLGRPRHWAQRLSQMAHGINAVLGAPAVEAQGRSRRTGYRVVVGQLPNTPLLTPLPRPVQVDPATGLRRHARWTAAEQQLLRAQAGQLPVSALAELVTTRCGVAIRTAHAVSCQLKQLGLSQTVTAQLSLRAASALLGVEERAVARRWLERGLLHATRGVGATRGGPYTITRDALATFIRTYPWEVDWRRMAPDDPLTVLARAETAREAWLTRAEAARYLGCSVWTVSGYLRDGKLPDARQAAPERAARPTSWRIPVSNLRTLVRRRRA